MKKKEPGRRRRPNVAVVLGLPYLPVELVPLVKAVVAAGRAVMEVTVVAAVAVGEGATIGEAAESVVVFDAVVDNVRPVFHICSFNLLLMSFVCEIGLVSFKLYVYCSCLLSLLFLFDIHSKFLRFTDCYS